MAKRQTRRSISVRGVTYNHLRDFCAEVSISMSNFVENRIEEFFLRAAATKPTARTPGTPRSAPSAPTEATKAPPPSQPPKAEEPRKPAVRRTLSQAAETIAARRAAPPPLQRAAQAESKTFDPPRPLTPAERGGRGDTTAF